MEAIPVETKQPEPIRSQRRPIGIISSINTNYIHLRNPWVIAAWSALFPGFGHIILGSYVKGFLLIGWEFLINTKAHINLGIMYSFLGQFDLASQALDVRWTLLYLVGWGFSIWGSYSLTVDLNKLTILGNREDSIIRPIGIGVMDINYIDKKQPWVAALLSMLYPGIGHLYTHRIPTSFFIIAMNIAIVYYSRILEGIQYSALGNFTQASAVLDPQWILFLPSLYGFSIYDSFVNTVEYNKLFEREQARFLKDNYQNPQFGSRLINAG